LDIILNAPVHTNDKDIDWAKYSALLEVPRFNLLESLPGLIRLADDEHRDIRSLVVGRLLHFSAIGYQDATQTLLRIRDSDSDAGIREQAKQGLLKIEEEQK